MTAADDETRRLDLTGSPDPAAEPTRVFASDAEHQTEVLRVDASEPTAVLWGPPRADERVDGPAPWSTAPDSYRPAYQPHQSAPQPWGGPYGQPASTVPQSYGTGAQAYGAPQAYGTGAQAYGTQAYGTGAQSYGAPQAYGGPQAYGAGHPSVGPAGYSSGQYAPWPDARAGQWGSPYAAPPAQSYPGPYPGYPAGYQPATPPPRRNNRGLTALIAFLLVATLGWASFTWMGNPLAGLAPGRTEPTTEPSSAPTRPTRPQRTQAQPGGGVDTDTTVRAAMSTGVVLISAETSSGAAAGTGMVITGEGRVLTNYHVVAGSEAIEVTLADSGDTYTATVVGFDQSRDVALLQLRDAGGLATVSVDDDSLQVGDDVSAVGNAGGGGVLVRANGLVTDLSEDLTVSSDSPWGSTEDLEGLIQTTAGAVPGHSGGPMFDEEAEVVGITTAGSTRAGTSYAVPIDEALSIVNQIDSGVEVGTVRIGPAGYLGVRVDDEERGATGVTVIDVTDDSPAQKAGLTEGSTLVRVGETTITRRTNVAGVIRSLEPGQQISISWIDPDGDQREATVTMGSSPVN